MQLSCKAGILGQCKSRANQIVILPEPKEGPILLPQVIIPRLRKPLASSIHLPCLRRKVKNRLKQKNQNKKWPQESMKNVEFMRVSHLCTAMSNMEMSLSPIGRKSEQDPAAGSVGGQPPYCSLSRKYVYFPAVPECVFGSTCCLQSHLLLVAPPPAPYLGHSRRERNVVSQDAEKKTFSVYNRQYRPRLVDYGGLMAVLTKGTSQWSSASCGENWENTQIFLEENEKQKWKPLILACLTASCLRKLDTTVKCIVVSSPSLVICNETLFQCFRKSTHF